MSNPLLRPNDPKFRKPDVRDVEGKNRFAEGEEEERDQVGDAGDVFAAASDGEARPFVPQYEAQQRSRVNLLLVLGGLGWGAAVVGTVSLTGIFDIGWLTSLLGIFPAGAAWLLAHHELQAVRAGAIDQNLRSPIQHAFWLGLTSLLACGVVVGAMIYRQMHFLPAL